jgi:hypothetical protein
MCEKVVFLEASKLIPLIVHRIHLGAIGAVKILSELQIIRRVGKDHIHRGCWELGEDFDAVACKDGVER